LNEEELARNLSKTRVGRGYERVVRHYEMNDVPIVIVTY
jgi:hypothetical protein